MWFSRSDVSLDRDLITLDGTVLENLGEGVLVSDIPEKQLCYDTDIIQWYVACYKKKIRQTSAGMMIWLNQIILVLHNFCFFFFLIWFLVFGCVMHASSVCATIFLFILQRKLILPRIMFNEKLVQAGTTTIEERIEFVENTLPSLISSILVCHQCLWSSHARLTASSGQKRKRGKFIETFFVDAF